VSVCVRRLKGLGRKTSLPFLNETYPSLDKVPSGGGPETSEESASALSADNLLEGAEEALVVLDGVELDAGLDHVQRGDSAVGDRAANASSSGGLDKVHDSKALFAGGGGRQNGGLGLLLVEGGGLDLVVDEHHFSFAINRGMNYL